MTRVEALFFWLAVWVYGVGFFAYLYGTVFKKERWLRYGWFLTVSGFTLHTASMGVRWWETGHPPVKGTYENSLLGGWFLIIGFMVIRKWQSKMEIIGAAILPVVLLMIGKGVMANPVLEPLSPPYRSNWLWFHVFFAWMAYGAFCVGAAIGTIYIVKERAGNGGRLAEFCKRFPDLGLLNDLTLRTVIFGFIALTVEIGAGAIWAYGLWGRYWNWDPIENWSLITWLTYGTYIHLGVTLGWHGRRMAWLALLALIFVFITFGGIGFFGGVHTAIL